MDEHEQRAREVAEAVLGPLNADGAYIAFVAARVATLFRGLTSAAVAAERERCAKVCEERGGPNEYCPNGCSFGALAEDIRATPLLPAQTEQRATETVRMLRCIAQMYAPDSPGGRALNHAVSAMSECCACDGHAGCAHVCAAPAQAEQRVSEERYDPSDPAHFLGASAYDAVIDALAKHDLEGMPHKWDKVAAQAVDHVVRKEAAIVLAASLAARQHRIAARLRARADEEWRIGNGATAHASDVLRSEADALEEGK
jgi:hypothetical protein